MLPAKLSGVASAGCAKTSLQRSIEIGRASKLSTTTLVERVIEDCH